MTRRSLREAGKCAYTIMRSLRNRDLVEYGVGWDACIEVGKKEQLKINIFASVILKREGRAEI